MRLMLLVSMMAALAAASFVASAPADAAGVLAARTRAPLHQTQQPVDQHDGSRVEVQLLVAGIAAGLVVGVGAGAYFLRRKLGLTAYSPDQAGGGHH